MSFRAESRNLDSSNPPSESPSRAAASAGRLSFAVHPQSTVYGPQPVSAVCPQSTVYGPRSSSAFTLMELLVVIAIIAILLGIIMPSFFTARDRARYTKAKVTVKNLETAFKAYLDHYRVWPDAFGGDDGSVQELDETVVKILRGDNEGGANSAKIAFYEFESTNTANGALDAWSDPNNSTTWQKYRVQVDHDYDNKIDMGGQTVYRTVVVWSYGADRTNNTEDDVRSWD